MKHFYVKFHRTETQDPDDLNLCDIQDAVLGLATLVQGWENSDCVAMETHLDPQKIIDALNEQGMACDLG